MLNQLFRRFHAEAEGAETRAAIHRLLALDDAALDDIGYTRGALEAALASPAPDLRRLRAAVAANLRIPARREFGDKARFLVCFGCDLHGGKIGRKFQRRNR